MAVVTVYVSDTSEITDPCYQASILLYKFRHPIVLNEDVYALSKLVYTEARVCCPNI
jgi:hypothetical protein